MWLARGVCAACGRGVARRARLPGRCDARCNLCGHRTRLLAWRPRGPAQAGVLAAIALLALLAAIPAAPTEGPPWSALEQTLVHEPDDGRSIYHLETRAVDRDGAPIALERLREFPAWHFATSEALASPADLHWYACEAPPECRFWAAAREIVYFTPGDPAGGYVNAYHPASGTAWLYAGGAWVAWGDASQALTFRLVAD